MSAPGLQLLIISAAISALPGCAILDVHSRIKDGADDDNIKFDRVSAIAVDTPATIVVQDACRKSDATYCNTDRVDLDDVTANGVLEILSFEGPNIRLKATELGSGTLRATAGDETAKIRLRAAEVAGVSVEPDCANGTEPVAPAGGEVTLRYELHDAEGEPLAGDMEPPLEQSDLEFVKLDGPNRARYQLPSEPGQVILRSAFDGEELASFVSYDPADIELVIEPGSLFGRNRRYPLSLKYRVRQRLQDQEVCVSPTFKTELVAETPDVCEIMPDESDARQRDSSLDIFEVRIRKKGMCRVTASVPELAIEARDDTDYR